MLPPYSPEARVLPGRWSDLLKEYSSIDALGFDLRGLWWGGGEKGHPGRKRLPRGREGRGRGDFVGGCGGETAEGKAWRGARGKEWARRKLWGRGL